MRKGFVVGAMRFFALTFIVGLVLLLASPLGDIRVFCMIAVVCAAAGFALNAYALHDVDPQAFTALRNRFATLTRRMRTGAHPTVAMDI